MNKTDVVFYLSIIGLEAKELLGVFKATPPKDSVDWIVISLGVVATVSYALYDHFTQTTPVAK